MEPHSRDPRQEGDNVAPTCGEVGVGRAGLPEARGPQPASLRRVTLLRLLGPLLGLRMLSLRTGGSPAAG